MKYSEKRYELMIAIVIGYYYYSEIINKQFSINPAVNIITYNNGINKRKMIACQIEDNTKE